MTNEKMYPFGSLGKQQPEITFWPHCDQAAAHLAGDTDDVASRGPAGVELRKLSPPQPPGSRFASRATPSFRVLRRILKRVSKAGADDASAFSLLFPPLDHWAVAPDMAFINHITCL
jgi:hypothetical protein